MKTFSVYVSPDVPEKEALVWMWETFAAFAQIRFEYVPQTGTGFSIGTADTDHVRHNPGFWQKINDGIYDGKSHLDAHGTILFPDGGPDLFTTAFYFVNCVWEYDQTLRDNLGRSDHGQSVWQQTGLDCTVNRVAHLFVRICEKLGVPVPQRQTEIFLSHDIDSVYGAWKEDGKAALKKGKIGAFVSGVYRHFFGRPAWYNINEIMAEESAHGAKSTFFWLTEKGRLDARRTNADYDIASADMRALAKAVSDNGFENGLHKSLAPCTFAQEFAKLPAGGRYNRHHYLHFSVPACYRIWEEAGLQVDCSMGYAEHFGFRNGYGLPYFPFDLDRRKTVTVLQVPLHVMDGTFSKYKNISAEEAYESIAGFMDANRQHAVISILWHNSHFTDFKYEGYPLLYTRLLERANGWHMRFTSLGELWAKYKPARPGYN